LKFGISSRNRELLNSIVKRYLDGGVLILYGSRAKGNFRDRSDVDLVIRGNRNLDFNLIGEIKDEISDSDFPYLVDLQFYESIKNRDLLEHIDRVGKVLLN